ncbi:MAG: hypothetical protein DYG91_02580 [Chloroflexi bacterium CFX7]|nr:hypothetical protein [Chloroflexi bacterium CFX7]MCK6565634.1 hypothetical protein [Dehalococcoidia bacterium]RIL01977.1 MAG: hypothetical protein DCC78_09045 [bacterium]
MMTAEATNDAEARVKAASTHLYEAMTHHFGPLDLGAHQPIVRAISEYAQRNREHDDAGIQQASAHVYEALSRHFGPLDLAANDPLVKALAEYGDACRAAGLKA